MATISHYVVTYNHETHLFENDVNTAVSKFADGWMYDDVIQCWEFPEDIVDLGNDDDGSEILTRIINEYNEFYKEGSEE